MKKTVLILLVLVFSFGISYADVFNVTLFSNNDDQIKIGSIERSLQILPTVMYDDNSKMVIITSVRLIENARITITDNNGLIVANDIYTLSRNGIRIQLPDTGENVSYLIEIEYGDTYLYGIID